MAQISSGIFSCTISRPLSQDWNRSQRHLIDDILQNTTTDRISRLVFIVYNHVALVNASDFITQWWFVIACNTKCHFQIYYVENDQVLHWINFWSILFQFKHLSVKHMYKACSSNRFQHMKIYPFEIWYGKCNHQSQLSNFLMVFICWICFRPSAIKNCRR